MTLSANTVPIEPKKALFELTLLNAECSDAEFEDVLIDSLKRDIPAEIVTRLSEIWAKTKVIGGELIAIGKIIVRKILEFLLANPKLTVGIAVGAALSTLIAGIPLIGHILAPLAATVSMLYGAGIGAAMQNGDYSLSPFSAGIELAHKFFELFLNIFNALTEYFTPDL